MRAVVIARPGGPEVLEIRTVPVPKPGTDDIRVRVRAFGINRADLLQRRGLYPAPADSPQDIPGLELAGEIESVGAHVRHLEVGTPVMAIAGGGTYAEYAVIPAAHAIPIPAGMSYEDAAAIPEAFLTAFDALEQLGVAGGEWVLVHAVGSGVGTAAVQLIRARDAKCIGTSRTREKLDRAASLGLDGAIETGAENVVDGVRRITGGGVHAAVDLIGGAGFNDTLKALRPRGRVIVVGLTAGAKADVDLGIILRQRLRIIGTVLRSRSREEKSAITALFARHALVGFRDGVLRPVVDRVFDLDEIAAAHAYVETNVNFGKVIVRVP